MWPRRAAFAALLAESTFAFSPVERACRCLPGDDCWPKAWEWQQLNATVGGRLVATTPLASSCHRPNYDESACQALRDEWQWPRVHYASSSSAMAPFFANRSCDPFTPPDAPCELGNYIRYAVNVSSSDHVAAAIRFATEKNVRLVIRNTGHDYLGKSTGAGALTVWTHHLKSVSIVDHASPAYSGKAIKLGAGVQGWEAYAAADAAGLAVVGGECPTVGIAGGYSQGGGHSALSSRHGLAADQALEWEVVDGTGEVRVANRHRNPDLFWALSGGGGGTYAVVLSLTAKAHPDVPVAAANLSFTSDGLSPDTFYGAIGAWEAELPRFVDAGAMAIYTFTNASFAIAPITAPGLSLDALAAMLRPYKDKLSGMNVTYASHLQAFAGYLPGFSAMQSPIQVGIAQYGGWLLPRSVVAEKGDDLLAAYRNITGDGATVINIALNVSKAVAGDVDNAVLPAWRDALVSVLLTTPWDFTAPWEDMIEWQHRLTDGYIPRLTALAPESGCYLNEADFRQPDWQRAFYGGNYDRLREIKRKYDPSDLFYGTTAVGSDEWTVERDGRMCRSGRSATARPAGVPVQQVWHEP